MGEMRHTPTGDIRPGMSRLSASHWRRLWGEFFHTVRHGADILAVCWGASDTEGRANAARFAACWRACHGLSLPADVEVGALARVVEAAKRVSLFAGNGLIVGGDHDADAALGKLGAALSALQKGGE